MTRWARNKSAQKHAKLPSDSTPWSELKGSITTDGNLKQNVEKLKKSHKNSISPSNKQFKICHRDGKKAKVFKHKRVNSFTIVPLPSNDVPLSSDKKDTKMVELNKGLKKSKNAVPKNSIEENCSGKQELTEKEKLEKKEKYREKLIKKRNERGIQLLSQKVERKIYNMKRGMRKKGMSGDEIKEAVRKFRRIEELRFRKDSVRLCLRCRNPGHKVAECQEILNDHEQSMGVCFKCGSTEHKLSQCNSTAEKNGVLPFAKCFVCGGLGHLSSSCAKNPKGKYPKGGACKVCGSINHFANDCPQDQRTLADEPTASLIIQGVSADMDDWEENKILKGKPKNTVISF